MATPTTLPATFVAGNVLTASQMNNLRGAFRVLQTLSTAKTDTFSLTSSVTTYTDVTGLSVTITPSATTSKVLIIANISLATSSGAFGFARLAGGSSASYIGNAAGSRIQAAQGNFPGSDAAAASCQIVYLDSPATVAATTYKVQISCTGGANIHVNRSHTDADNAAYVRGASSITVMEISA